MTKRRISLAAAFLLFAISVTAVGAITTDRISVVDRGLFELTEPDTIISSVLDLDRMQENNAVFTGGGYRSAAWTGGGMSGLYNIPGDFPDLATAIDTLNISGVSGPVTINLIAGNPQTAPAGGYTIGRTCCSDPILTTTSATNTVTLVGNGNTITASPSHNVGSLTDAIFKLIGTDFITISGFVMLENPANTAMTPASNNMTEFGVALFYWVSNNGAQNNTISNNTIDLERLYRNSFGIYSNSSHSSFQPTTIGNAIAGGSNSGLTITGNQITDVNCGIVIIGATTAANHNDGLTIGGSVANGNTITNFGSEIVATSYINFPGGIPGILVRNTVNADISHNSVSSALYGGTGSQTLAGITIPTFSNVPTGTFTNSINNNSISLRSAVASVSLAGIVSDSGSNTATSSININNNNFHTFGHSVAGTGQIQFIRQWGTHLNQSISGNTFTNMSVNTTNFVTFINNSNTAPAGGTKNVNNNSIVTGFTSTGSGTVVSGIQGSGSDPAASNINNVLNNNFSNITLPAVSEFSGISVSNRGTKTVSGNTISNITSGSGTTSGMSISTSPHPTTVTGNTISNLTGGGVVVGLAVSDGVGPQTVTRNTVRSLSGTGTGSVVSGISLAPSSTNTDITIANNYIGDLTAPNATNFNAITGMRILTNSDTTNIKFYFNTIYVNNTSSGAGFGSSGIFVQTNTTATTSNLDLRNNIIVNTSIHSGAGRTVAFRRSSGNANALNNYAATSNNNLFYAGTPGPNNLIYFDGISGAETIADYRNGVFTAGTIFPRDSFSVSEMPPFLSTDPLSPDYLRISSVIPTQVESGGQPIAGITDDFDGDLRNLTSPDIGADEGPFIALDASGPVIIYTPLTSTTSTSNRIQTVTLMDATGVATGAVAPRIYFRKNAGTYVSTDCSLTGGTVQNGTWDCEIDNTLLGGVTASDTIDYFVAAQDTFGNLSGNPFVGFAGTDVNNITSAPTSPRTYNILFEVSGDFDIGTGETYESLTNPGGIFEYINNNVVVGNINLTITTNLTAEIGTHALNDLGPGFSLSIRPASDGLVISGATVAGRGLIELNGADNVTIDGDNPNTPGINRDLTIRNTAANTITFTSVIRIALNTTTVNSADNNIFRNLNIIGSATGRNIATQTTGDSVANSTFGIFAGSGATGPGSPSPITSVVAGTGAGATAINLLVSNNRITMVGRGITINGASATIYPGLQIVNNEIGNPVEGDADQVYNRAITAQGSSDGVISGNTVYVEGYLAGSGGGATVGIDVGSNSANGTFLIEKNRILRARNNNTETWPAYGINIGGSSNHTVRNNFVTNVINNQVTGTGAFNAFGAFGIRVGAGTGHTIHHNSVNMHGAMPGTTNTNLTGAFSISSTGQTGLNVRNNIFVNTITGGNPTGTRNVAMLVPTGATSSFNLTLNNNDYFVGSDPQNRLVQRGLTFGTGEYTLADFDPSDTANVLNFRNYSSTLSVAGTNDDASLKVDPLFTSSADLHLTAVSPMIDVGVDVGVVDDIDGDARPQGAGFDIGADEVFIAAPQFTLTITLAGAGTGTVTSAPAGILCPGVCTEDFNENTVVTLSANADMGSVFVGWAGEGCAGTGTCIVTMSQARNVTATFDVVPSPTPTPTTEVQFGATSFMDDESQSAVITVTRTGSLTGASSVDVVLADNTAMGGVACTSSVDYIYSGPINVSFAIGIASQTFSVPLCSDTLLENTETVDMLLTTPAGADIGTPSTATLLINDTANQWRNTAPIEMFLGSVANPHPSTITATGAPASVGSIRVTLYDFYHDLPDNVDILLVGPNGNKYVLMADVGGPAPGIPFPNHVTLTFSDIAAQTVPDSTPPATGNYKPTNCETPVLSFAPPAPAAPYAEPGCALIRPVEQSLFGNFGLADGNGVWSLYIRDDAGSPFAPDALMGEILGGWGLELLPPTSAGVEVSGRVMTPDGRGLRNATVTMTDVNGVTRSAVTSSFGYYKFEGINAGENYLMGVSSRTYRFVPRVVVVTDTLTDVDFVGLE
ncbi:MAG: hypothetical protein IPM50_05755 [Acidobacteriota bacterium]|nr:MAG: hypothetical protein IPM50_05755 [Acidobacteriota bacterium]